MERLDSVFAVGTGSGVLRLLALLMGVAQAVGLDIDAETLKVAADNARVNNLADRSQLILAAPRFRWQLAACGRELAYRSSD